MKLAWMRAVVRHHRLVIGLAIAATLAALAGTSRLHVAHSIEMWLLPDDPDLAAHRDLVRRFGRDDALVVTVTADDVTAPRVLAAMKRLGAKLETLPHVARVISLADALDVDDDGTFDRAGLESRLADRPGLDPYEPMRGALIDALGRAGSIVVELDRAPGEATRPLVEAVRRECDDATRRASARCAVGGAAVLDDAFVSLSRRDLVVLGPLVALVVLAVLVLRVRHRAGVIALVVTVTVSVTWTLGITALLGIELHLLTLTAPPLLLAVGVAEAVHVLTELRAESRHAESAREAVARAAASVLVPCVFTALTTACGYASLIGSKLGPVRDLGVMCVVGSVAAFIGSFTLLPALLAILPPPRTTDDEAEPLATRWLVRASRFGTSRPGIVIAVLATVVALATWGTSRLRVRASDVDNFPRSHRAIQDALTIDHALGGALALDVLVEGPRGMAADPAALARVERIERRLAARTAGRVESLPRVLRFSRALLVGGAPSLATTRDESRELLDDVELLVPGIDRLVTRDRSAMRLRARFSYASFGELDVDAMRALLAAESRGGLRARPGGLAVLLRNVEGYLLDSQIQSAASALVLVWLAMLGLLRSFRLALVAMIPNVAPLVIVLGVMGALGIPLDVATTMIVSIGLGIAVDDTIHLLDRWRRERAAGKSAEQAAHAAIARVGPPVITTTLVLAAGCLVLLTASFQPDVRFGALTALAVVLAFAHDVFVTPAVLVLVERLLPARLRAMPGQSSTLPPTTSRG